VELDSYTILEINGVGGIQAAEGFKTLAVKAQQHQTF
jgi:hypothetical protein